MPVVLLIERSSTVGRVDAAGGVAEKRSPAVSRVAAAGGVAIKRLNTVGRVVAPAVLLASARAPVAVLLPPVVAIERLKPTAVLQSRGEAKEGIQCPSAVLPPG